MSYWSFLESVVTMDIRPTAVEISLCSNCAYDDDYDDDQQHQHLNGEDVVHLMRVPTDDYSSLSPYTPSVDENSTTQDAILPITTDDCTSAVVHDIPHTTSQDSYDYDSISDHLLFQLSPTSSSSESSCFALNRYSEDMSSKKQLRSSGRSKPPSTKIVTSTVAPSSDQWKCRIDPKSKKQYYVNVTTGKTQWDKPYDLLSNEEKQQRLKLLKIFREMEFNILQSLAVAQPIPGISLGATVRSSKSQIDSSVVSNQPIQHYPPKLNINSPIRFRKVFDSKLQQEKIKKNNGHLRRNSGGTIYVDSTIAAGDFLNIIRGVCTHFMELMKETFSSSPNSVLKLPQTTDIFNHSVEQKYSKMSSTNESPILSQRTSKYNATHATLDEMVSFFTAIHDVAQMGRDVPILSIIYIERLIELSNGDIFPTQSNWRLILASCMNLASKVYDDLAMLNADFSRVCLYVTKDQPGMKHAFSLSHINKIEVVLLEKLKYNVRVSASEYAKYYFLMRSKCTHTNDSVQESLLSQPLDFHRAKSLDMRLIHFYESSCYENLIRPTNSFDEAATREKESTNESIRKNTCKKYGSMKRLGLEDIILTPV